ncbi:MAG: hypothetical protein M1514_01345 [Patescibacteria group bacterium]|nr:hypothetical protein [Patescibacteria group bacterium]
MAQLLKAAKSSHSIAIIVPGLGNENKGHELLVKWWKLWNIKTYICGLNWKIEENGFTEKLKKITDLIDKLYAPNKKISLIGTSAGGSAVLNAFIARKNKVHRIVNVCGRLRSGDALFYTFEKAASKSPSFKESVLKFEKTETKLTNQDKEKIMTIKPIWDEIVPASTVKIKGAKNILVPSIGHVLSISLSLSLFAYPIIEFIKSD